MESLRFNSPHPLSDRLIRAIRHRLRLLHRSHSTFFVLGATSNVYTVALSSSPSCTCPDRTTPCKHILFVYIRALGIPLDDPCLQRRTLRPCQLARLLSAPTSPESLAGPGVRSAFHRLYFGRDWEEVRPKVEVKEGTTCPICLDEMGIRKEERAVACGTCKNVIHEECWSRWKRSRGRRAASCVICRARWRERERNHTVGQDNYLNLSAYVSEDEMGESSGGGGLCGG